MSSRKPSPQELRAAMQILDFMANEDEAETVTQPADSDFWSSDNPKIIIRDQPAIALTISPAGDLLLRQHDVPRDAVIIVTKVFLPQFLEDLCDALGVKPRLWSPKKQEK